MTERVPARMSSPTQTAWGLRVIRRVVLFPGVLG